ncbi:MAG: DNA cytosine methyltransferase [Verrucomicrobiota bacterium]
MPRPQLSLDLNAELIVDNFAGGGGASTGIEMALGRSPDIAANHDKDAVAMHQANHPQTRHYCESVFDVDPARVTQGRGVGLAWFSPDCKHFSKAKGGKPRDKNIRGLAWVVINWVNRLRETQGAGPRVIMLENVEEFQDWGPIDKSGSPIDICKGWFFQCFKGALERRGYEVDWRELRGCDYGAPTIRKRLFLIARCDGAAIVWPEPTHASPKERAKGLKPWRNAAECIDFSLPCPSIFERKRPLVDATCRRIAKGIMRYVVNAAEPFIVNTANTKTTGRGPNNWPIKEPVRTLTSSPGFALVSPILTEHANGSTQRNFDPQAPLRTQCAEVKGGHFALVSAFLAKHYTGVTGTPVNEAIGTITAKDHHSLVATHLVRHFGQSTGQDCAKPAPTVTANGQGKTGLVTSHLMKLRGNPDTHPSGKDCREPIDTISAQGNHFAEVRSFLIKYYGTDQDPRMDDPLHTVTTKHRFGLVTVHGVEYAIADIGLRMLQPKELFAAQGFPEDYIIDRGQYEREDGQGWEWRRLTKTAQVRMCGNSVCPPLAAAIVRANCADMSAVQRGAA